MAGTAKLGSRHSLAAASGHGQLIQSDMCLLHEHHPACSCPKCHVLVAKHVAEHVNCQSLLLNYARSIYISAISYPDSPCTNQMGQSSQRSSHVSSQPDIVPSPGVADWLCDARPPDQHRAGHVMVAQMPQAHFAKMQTINFLALSTV